MAGFKGQLRTPDQAVRVRRNADGLASSVPFIDPANGIILTGDGTLALATGAGTAVSGGDLTVVLASNPGLEFDNDALRVLAVAPLQRTASGLSLSLGNGVAESGGSLVVDLASNPGLAFAGGDLHALVADPLERTASGLGLKLASGGGLELTGGELGISDDALVSPALLTNEDEDDYLFGLPEWEVGDTHPLGELLVEDA